MCHVDAMESDCSMPIGVNAPTFAYKLVILKFSCVLSEDVSLLEHTTYAQQCNAAVENANG